MLIHIPLLAFLMFGFTYPLFLWLNAKQPIKNNFHRFHLGCPVVIAGVAIVGLWLMPVVDQNLKIQGGLWLALGLLITGFFWNKEKVNPWAITVLSAWGIVFFIALYGQLLTRDVAQIALCLLSGFIVSAIFYAMNLGHFYLNVHGLKINHLKDATLAFGGLLALRLVWDVYALAVGTVMYGGEKQSLFSFMNSTEGFMLWVALFFGTIFPLGALYFAFGTLRLKNTQATTGILYVLLSAVLLGDLAYKYYLLKFGIAM
jgi:hypothetical protein